MSDSYTRSLVSATVTFLVLNAIAVSLRLYVRLGLVKAFGWDDVVLVLAYLGYCTSCVLGYVSIHYGFTAVEYKPWYNTNLMIKYYWANQLVLYISSGIVKIAIALVLYRLACNLRNQAILVTTILVILIWTFITTIFASDICAEATGATDYASGAVCTGVGYFRMISNVVFDFFLALYPVPLLWNSTLSRRMKYIVCGLLSLGIIASIATVVKLFILVQLQYAKPDQLNWLHYQMLVWAEVELGLSIFAASAAALRPLLRAVIGHSRSNDTQFSAIRSIRGLGDDEEPPRLALHQQSFPIYAIMSRKEGNAGEYELNDLTRCGGGPMIKAEEEAEQLPQQHADHHADHHSDTTVVAT